MKMGGGSPREGEGSAFCAITTADKSGSDHQNDGGGSMLIFIVDSFLAKMVVMGSSANILDQR